MDDKIEAVARALCRLDGRDPDQRRGGKRPAGFQTYVGDPPADGPAEWESYTAEAERFVVAAEALMPFARPEIKRW